MTASPRTVEQLVQDLDDGHELPDTPARGLAYELDRIQQSMPLTDGALAEQRHLLDPDPDPDLFHLPGISHKKETETA